MSLLIKYYFSYNKRKIHNCSNEHLDNTGFSPRIFSTVTRSFEALQNLIIEQIFRQNVSNKISESSNNIDNNIQNETINIVQNNLHEYYIDIQDNELNIINDNSNGYGYYIDSPH